MNTPRALRVILSSLTDDDVALFTTGFISRRAFHIKDRDNNFYMLGSMGLLSALGLGIALNKPSSRVVVIEGDGSALMSLGNLPLIGSLKPTNFYHIVLDNGSYESTGGQPTIAREIDLSKIAEAAGYEQVSKVKKPDELLETITELFNQKGPCFILVKVKPSEEIGQRVSLSPEEIKERLRRVLIGI